MKRRRALILLHPRARRHGYCSSLLRHLDEQYECCTIESDYPGLFRLEADRYLEGFEGLVFTAGGDGTLHEAVNGWAELGFPPGIRFAPLPLGTGNDFLASLDDQYRSARSFLTLPFERLLQADMGRVSYSTPEGRESRYFCVGATCGLSGQVTALRARWADLLPGKLSYLLAMAVSFLSWKNRSVQVESETVSFRSKHLINFNAANVKHYGGGMISAPRARASTGTLEAVSMNLSLWDALKNLRENFRGDFDKISAVEQFPIEDCLRVECLPECPVQADGESLGSTPMELEVLPGKLPLALPEFSAPGGPG